MFYLIQLTIALILQAYGQAPVDSFLKGVEAYNKKQYTEAEQHFQSILENDPYNLSVLTNLAITSYQLEKKGLAIGYLRLALDKNGFDIKANKTLGFIQQNLAIKEIPHEQLVTEEVRELFLVPVSSHIYLAVLALLTLAWGWVILSYFGYRRRSLFSEQTPSLPSPIFYLLGIMWVISLGLTGYEIYDGVIPRATIISVEASAFSAPSESGVELFKLYEGFEVILGKTRDKWTQVTYPGGLSGWVKQEHLFHSSGTKLW